MGIPAIFTAAMKQVSWGKVATAAIQYGPDLIRKLKEQVQSRHDYEDQEVRVDELSEEISHLRTIILDQEKIIEASNSKIIILEKNCNSLQSRLKLVMALSVALAAASVALSVALFSG